MDSDLQENLEANQRLAMNARASRISSSSRQLPAGDEIEPSCYDPTARLGPRLLRGMGCLMPSQRDACPSLDQGSGWSNKSLSQAPEVSEALRVASPTLVGTPAGRCAEARDPSSLSEGSKAAGGSRGGTLRRDAVHWHATEGVVPALKSTQFHLRIH